MRCGKAGAFLDGVTAGTTLSLLAWMLLTKIKSAGRDWLLLSAYAATICFLVWIIVLRTRELHNEDRMRAEVCPEAEVTLDLARGTAERNRT